MKTIKYVLILISLATAISSDAKDHRVKGYVKDDGTYVAPHRQTDPDSNQMNNYSSGGNINPYTGKNGTVKPSRKKQK